MQRPEHSGQPIPLGLFGVVHHHHQLSRDLLKSSELLVRHIGRRRQEPGVPADRGQVMAQLDGHTSLPRAALARHHGHGDIGTGAIRGVRGSAGRGRCPLAQLAVLGSLFEGDDGVPGLDELQGREILRQWSTGRGKYPLKIASRRNGVVGFVAALTTDVNAHVPLPFLEVVGAPGKSSAPIAVRHHRLLNVDGQPRARRIVGALRNNTGERAPVHRQWLTAEPRLDHGVAPGGPCPPQRHYDNRVPLLPVGGGECDYEGVDPGVQRGAAEGHAQIHARRLPEGEHLGDGPDPLCPRNAIRRLVDILNTQIH